MRNASWLLFAALLSMSTTAAAANGDIDFFRKGTPKDRVAGVALVQLKGIDAHQLVVNQKVLGEIGARTGLELSFVRPLALGWAMLEVRDAHNKRVIPDEATTLAMVQRLKSDAAVKDASDDKWMKALRVPNDPGLPQMWHFDVIHAQQAWDVTQGLTSQRIGIIDTGLVRSHEDVGNRAVGGFDFISSANTGNDGNGRDSDFNDPGDACNGAPSSFHGTHVAGTIGATADNGIGVVGLNWNAGLVIARALGKCGGDLADIADAAVWLSGGHVDGVPDAGGNKVSVINLSLGSDSQCSGLEQQAVDFANSQNTMFVAAAGNSGFQLGQTNSVGSPANCNGAIAVGAHGPQRELSGYSSFGPEVSIVGPGGDEEQFGQAGGVLSSIGPNGDAYAFEEGTSMATPHITGAISLMQAVNASLTRSQIVSILQSSGTACTGCNGKKAIVLDAALAAVSPGTPPPPPPPPPTDDAFEENDGFDQAKNGVISCGTTENLVALAADQDWFLLDTVPGESIDITIHGANTTGGDLDLYALVGPTDADIVARSETNTGDEAIHVDADGTQLHVLVNPFVDTQNGVNNNGPYAITVACTGNQPTTDPTDPTDPGDPTTGEGEGEGDVGEVDDDSEDNDSLDAAVETFCGEEIDLVANDDDFFKIEVRQGDLLSAQVTSSVALSTAIMSSNGDVLGTGDETLVASARDLPAGTFIVKVSPVNGHGAYHLKTACAGTGGSQPLARGTGCAATGTSAAPIGFIAIVLLILSRRRRR